MTNKWSRLLLCVVLAGFTTLWATAQDTDTKSKGDVRHITGCLTKGDSAGEYLLTGNDGSTWEIHKQDSADLSGHVGKTVTVKGVVDHSKMHNMKEDAKDAAKDSGMTKHDNEHGHLTVTDVHTVGESCQQ